MKSVSSLILICAFACASAQFGVKGGASGSPKGLRTGTFFPRLTPGSIQEKKEQLQLASVDEVSGGPSVVVGGVGSTGSSNGFVQPAGQQENVFTFVQERPTQNVLVPSSGSVSVPVAPVSTSVGPQSQVVQSVAPVQSSFSFVPSFQPVLPAPAVGSVPVAQVSQVVQPAVSVAQPTVSVAQPAVSVVQPAVQSFQTFAPLTRTFQSNGLFFENRQPQQLVQFGAAPAFPNFAQTISHFAPQPQVATVQTVPSFTSNVGNVGKSFISRPAPVPSFPSVASGFTSVQPVAPVAPVSGKLFTDNKISTGFGTVQQQQLPSPVISQEKQSAETVQTLEW